MHNLADILSTITGVPIPWLPQSRRQWIAHAVATAASALRGSQLIASGSALVGGDQLILTEAGISTVLATLARGKPVLNLRKVTTQHKPLEFLLSRFGLNPAEKCVAVISIGGLLVIYGKAHGREVVSIAATNENTRLKLERHGKGLRLAHLDFARHRLRKIIPDLVVDNAYYMQQSRIVGTAGRPAELSLLDLRRAIAAGLKVAQEINKFGQARQNKFDSSRLYLQVRSLRNLFPEGSFADLEYASDALGRRLASGAVMSVPTHGDFWLGNLCFDNEFTEVTGVLDWERYQSAGVPLLDAVQLIVTSVAIHRHGSVAQILPSMWSGGDPVINKLLCMAEDTFEISSDDFRWSAIAVWINYAMIGTSEPRPRNFSKWIDEISALPAGAAVAWLKIKDA